MAEGDIVGRGYEDNKSSTDHVGFSGIAQSSVSTSLGLLWELVHRRGYNPVPCGRTFRRARAAHDMTVNMGEVAQAEFKDAYICSKARLL